MKQITINGKEYNIDCNAFTYIKYKSIFKTGIIQDMQFIQNYLIEQTVLTKQLEKRNMSEAEKLSKISEYMIDKTDEFVAKITQVAWILIYSVDEEIEEYEKWLKSITKFKIDDDWIAEVTEFAVNCFCG